MESEETCSTCRFFKPDLREYIGQDEGWCRFNAPAFCGPGMHGGFPRVPEDNWCGQYEKMEDGTC